MQLQYFSEWFLNGKDVTIYLKGLQKLSMKSSVFSLYPIASMTIQLDSTLIESGELVIGASSKFLFTRDTPYESVEREYKVWKIEQSSPESARSFNGFYTITFLHPWYFRQYNVSKAYFGAVWSVIAQSLLEENRNDFTGIYLDKSIDKEGKYFRTYQTQGNFIEKRMIQNYLVDDSPVFMYVNDKKEFHAHSFTNMLEAQQNNIAVDARRISIDTGIYSAAKDKNRLFEITSFNYNLNKTGNIWNMIKSKITKLYRNTHSVHPPSGLTSQDYSSFGKGFFPISNDLKSMDKPLAVFIDDSENQSNAIYSSFLLKQREFLLDNQITVVGPANFTMQVGQSIELYFKKSEDESINDDNSVFNAKYVIMSIEHFYQDANMISVMVLFRGMITPVGKNVTYTTKSLIL